MVMLFSCFMCLTCNFQEFLWKNINQCALALKKLPDHGENSDHDHVNWCILRTERNYEFNKSIFVLKYLRWWYLSAVKDGGTLFLLPFENNIFFVSINLSWYFNSVPSSFLVNRILSGNFPFTILNSLRENLQIFLSYIIGIGEEYNFKLFKDWRLELWSIHTENQPCPLRDLIPIWLRPIICFVLFQSI